MPGYLALFLEMVKDNEIILASKVPLQYYFRLELISLNMAGKTISKEYCSTFGLGDCWGYSDFISLEELPEYFNEGKLLFVVGIKYKTYYDLYQNMCKYVRVLEGEKNVFERLLSVGEPYSSEVYNRLEFESDSESDLI